MLSSLYTQNKIWILIEGVELVIVVPVMIDEPIQIIAMKGLLADLPSIEGCIQKTEEIRAKRIAWLSVSVAPDVKAGTEWMLLVDLFYVCKDFLKVQSDWTTIIDPDLGIYGYKRLFTPLTLEELVWQRKIDPL